MEEDDTFDGLRSRIAALEAVNKRVRELWAGWLIDSDAIDETLTLAPSVVLDQMIREAKAEAVETARDSIMPPVNWNLRPDGTEMPGTQHVDEALHDIHVQLSEMAAEYRKVTRD